MKQKFGGLGESFFKSAEIMQRALKRNRRVKKKHTECNPGLSKRSGNIISRISLMGTNLATLLFETDVDMLFESSFKMCDKFVSCKCIFLFWFQKYVELFKYITVGNQIIFVGVKGYARTSLSQGVGGGIQRDSWEKCFKVEKKLPQENKKFKNQIKFICPLV